MARQAGKVEAGGEVDREHTIFNPQPINRNKIFELTSRHFARKQSQIMSAPAPNGANTAPPAANDARDPSGFLSEIIGAPVTVKLNSGVVYKGMFTCYTCLAKEMLVSLVIIKHTC
jgi:hypothetical protein